MFRFGVPPSGGRLRSRLCACERAKAAAAQNAELRTTSPDRPNPCHSRLVDVRAKSSSLPSHRSASDTPLRCSTASPSSAIRNGAALDCDECNLPLPSSAGPTASRARQCGRKLFAREFVLRYSRRTKCGREGVPVHTVNVLRLALPPGRDNDWATRTTRTSGLHEQRIRPASFAKNSRYAADCGQYNDGVRNKLLK